MIVKVIQLKKSIVSASWNLLLGYEQTNFPLFHIHRTGEDTHHSGQKDSAVIIWAVLYGVYRKIVNTLKNEPINNILAHENYF